LGIIHNPGKVDDHPVRAGSGARGRLSLKMRQRIPVDTLGFHKDVLERTSTKHKGLESEEMEEAMDRLPPP
jgi:hypothetical protein